MLMKKIAIICAVFAIASCSKEKGSADTEFTRKEFTQTCIEGAKQQAAAQGVQLDEIDIETFCNCSADKVLAELSQEELVKLGMQDQEIMQKTQDLTAPCLQDFLEKLQNQLMNQYIDQVQ